MVREKVNQNSSCEKVNFLKPTVVSFVGIPGSGKSTITRKLGTILNSRFYLEPEEKEYPNDLKEKFSDLKKPKAALGVYKYFRDVRVKNLLEAKENKTKEISSVLDCFYDKIMIDILGKPKTDCFIDSKGRDFKEILKIAKDDSLSLPDVDLLFFLNLSNKKLHDRFLMERGRKLDVSLGIYQAQKIFLEACVNYSKKTSTKLIVIERGEAGEDTMQKLIFSLEKEKLVSLPKFVRVALSKKDFPKCFLLVKNKKGGWNFPGGKVEKGEKLIDAAKREVFEETNLLVENLEKVAENVFLIKGKWWKGYFYQATSFSGEVINKVPNEILDTSFFEHHHILKNEQINEITKSFLRQVKK